MEKISIKYRHLTWLFHKDLFVDVMVKYRFYLSRIDRSDVNFVTIDFSFFFVALRPNAGHGLLILEVLDHTQRRTAFGMTPLDE